MCTQPQELCDAIVSVWTKTFDFWSFLCKIVASCTLQYNCANQKSTNQFKGENWEQRYNKTELSFVLLPAICC